MRDYEVKISECSKELDKRERIRIKDLSDAIRIDKATQLEELFIDVDYYAILDIHSENSEDKDYQNIMVVDMEGNKYVTGSKPFTTSFLNIFSEMEGEAFQVKCYRLPSKKREGKDFLTCSLM